MTGPFFARMPSRLSARATAGGKHTIAWAVAVRALTALAPTSTIRGRLAWSRCMKPDFLSTRRGRGRSRAFAAPGGKTLDSRLTSSAVESRGNDDFFFDPAFFITHRLQTFRF